MSSKEPLAENKDMNLGDFVVSVKKVKVIATVDDPKTFLFFLNNKFRNVMAQTGYVEIGRTGKYFNIKTKKEIDNLNMFSGFKANFCIL